MDGYYVDTFLCNRPVEPDAVRQMEPDMAVEWVLPDELITGRCGEYNMSVLNAYMKVKGITIEK